MPQTDRPLFRWNTTLFALACAMLFASGVQAEQLNWWPALDEDGVVVMGRNTPGSEYHTYRANAVFDASFRAVIDLLENPESFPRWWYKCLEYKLLSQKDKDHRVAYMVTSVPWPFRNRDTVVQVTSSFLPKKGLLRAHMKAITGPATDRGYVRVHQMEGSMLFARRPDGKLDVLYENFQDPEGNIPVRLVNQSNASELVYTLSHMRKLVEAATRNGTTDSQNNAADEKREVLRPPHPR